MDEDAPSSSFHQLPPLAACGTLQDHANHASESAPLTLYEPEGRQFDSVRAHHKINSKQHSSDYALTAAGSSFRISETKALASPNSIKVLSI